MLRKLLVLQLTCAPVFRAYSMYRTALPPMQLAVAPFIKRAAAFQQQQDNDRTDSRSSSWQAGEALAALLATASSSSGI